MVTSCVGRRLLKYVIEGEIDGRIEAREDEEEYVGSYSITLRIRADTVN